MQPYYKIPSIDIMKSYYKIIFSIVKVTHMIEITTYQHKLLCIPQLYHSDGFLALPSILQQWSSM